MKSYLECYPCFVRQAIETARIATKDEAKHWEILKRTMEKCLDFSPENSPVEMGMYIHRIIREISGNPDPYKRIKCEYNRVVSDIETYLMNLITNSKDKMIMVLKLAAIGNIVDFGPQFHFENDFRDYINEKLKKEIFMNLNIMEFKDNLYSASNVLYIGDNCGEVVFDKLLIEHILKGKKVYYGVRGSPMLNDITLEDIKNIKFSKNVETISSGSDAPGIIIDNCSEKFKEVFYEVDIVIAKGQGNYESMSNIQRKNVYSLLIVKCPVIARHIGCDIGEMVLINII